MRKPEFEQFRQSTLRKAKPLKQQEREHYRASIVDQLEDTGLFLVQKSRKDGHDPALVEIHCTWIGADFSPEAVSDALKVMWPGSTFEKGEQHYWIEIEDEIVTLDFAWADGEGFFLTGRIKVTV